MRHLLTMTALGACGLVMAGCATTDNYASACERDYAENRNRAMAAGALLGGAIGAAVAGSEDRERGAAIGAAAGALLGLCILAPAGVRVARRAGHQGR